MSIIIFERVVKMKKKNFKELKSKFTIIKAYGTCVVNVEKSFVSKYKLSLFDIREIMRLMESIENGLYDSTINEKVANILKQYGVEIMQSYIGWEV